MKAVNAAEPARDDEGMPLNAQAWQRWYEHDYQPALARLNTAHRALEMSRGTEHSRHPFNYRPLCEQLVSS